MRVGTVLWLVLLLGCEQILGIHDVPINNTHVDAPTKLDAEKLDAGSGSGSGSACVAIPEWGSATSYPTPGAFTLAVGNLAGHGMVDIVVATGSDVLLLPNTGSGAFAPAKPLRGSGSPSPATNVLVADINDDGMQDIVAWTFLTNADHISIYLQTPGAPGTFDAPTDFIVPASPNAGAVGNFNGDSFPDLVFAGGGDVTAFISGSGTFNAGTFIGSANASVVAAFPIANPQGKLDDIAFVTGAGPPEVSFNEGSAKFSALSPIGEMPLQQVAFGDFYVTLPDIAIVTASPFGLLFEQPGENTWGLESGSAVAFAQTGPPSLTLGVDLNGDGKPDVIGFNQPAMVGGTSASAIEVALHE
jgi:hypothetical protein